MSDSEGDFSDELLELAGATEKKRRKRQAGKTGGSKKRKSGYVVVPFVFVPPGHKSLNLLCSTPFVTGAD